MSLTGVLCCVAMVTKHLPCMTPLLSHNIVSLLSSILGSLPNGILGSLLNSILGSY